MSPFLPLLIPDEYPIILPTTQTVFIGNESRVRIPEQFLVASNNYKIVQ
jgi:hypothetical protein